MVPCAPYAGAESFLQIDTFEMFDLFNFEMQAPLEGAMDVRAFTGNLHTNIRYYKDTFKISFPKLTQAQAFALNLICQQVGVGALHTVIYGAQGIIRKYDGSTNWSAGYGINDDVQRLRGLVRIHPIVMPHWTGISNIYSAILDCEEA